LPGLALTGDAVDLHLWLCHRDRVPDSDKFKRHVLSRYAPVAPSDWLFTASDNGKPYIAGATNALDFNLSHSRDWLACAVAAGAPVGVDLEFCDPRREVMKLARRFFCPQEVLALSATGTALQQDLFYDYWTLKEAAVKARGEALPPGLQQRCFVVNHRADPPAGPGSIAVNASAASEHAHYCLLDPLPGYRVAICSLAPPSSLPRLRVFELLGADAVEERSIELRASSWRL